MYYFLQFWFQAIFMITAIVLLPFFIVWHMACNLASFAACIINHLVDALRGDA